MTVTTIQSAPSSQSSPAARNRSRDVEGILRFTPNAWAKLLYFRDRGDTEIGGFGITDAADPLLVTEFRTVRQRVSSVSVAFDDDAVADYFDRCVDDGLTPGQFARIWLHTHPGSCPSPSGQDEQTFVRVFGGCEHAVMFIMARDGQCYSRLRFNVGPGGDILLACQVDYAQPFAASDAAAWELEYQANVFPQIDIPIAAVTSTGITSLLDDLPPKGIEGRPSQVSQPGWWDWPDESISQSRRIIAQIESLDPMTRGEVFDELSDRADLWQEAGYEY